MPKRTDLVRYSPPKLPKAPVVRLNHIHGVLPFDGIRNPGFRSSTSHRIWLSYRTAANGWQPKVGICESAAEAAVAIDALISPETYDVKFQPFSVAFEDEGKQREYTHELLITHRSGRRDLVFVRNGTSLNKPKTWREIEAISRATPPQAADNLLIVSSDDYSRQRRENLFRIGVHYDECQHVFIDGAKSNKIFLDSFKSMMKEPHWPMMLILSGVPTLSDYIRSYEQLEKLVDPVHFDEIRLKRDSDQLVKLLYCYADSVEMNIDELVTPDFLARLDHVCSHRWGLVIELLIKTLVEVKVSGKNELEANDFAVQFAAQTGTLMRSSPFTAPNLLTAFDSQRLFEINS
jgi:hypothetical protein